MVGDNTRMFRISKWRGINENADGDTKLKYGEAAEMRNFRITRDGNLQIRPGTRTILSFDGRVQGMFSGLVGDREICVCAAGGFLWETDYAARTAVCLGALNDAHTEFFGFSRKLYILNGSQYLVWDGTGQVQPVSGYRPLVSVTNAPSGGGVLLEQVNRLTGARRARFSPDGSSYIYMLPEQNLASIDYVLSLATGEAITGWQGDTEAGIITFALPPETGVNSLEIGWTAAASDRASVEAMRFSEYYSGTTDNRVFLYGDGSNRSFYSGLNYEGQPTAEYFPELNVLDAGSANSPITAMIRHHSRLLVFKTEGSYSTQFSNITLEDGSVTPAFYTYPVNREIGNRAPGQVRLVENNPRSLHGAAVYEWKTSSGNIAYDERSAGLISSRVGNTLGSFDFERCFCFDDETRQTYYIVCDGKAVCHNYDEDAWFIYTDFSAVCMNEFRGQLYLGTADGRIVHLSREHYSDDGRAIDAYWRSGSMTFEKQWQRKYSAVLFVTIKPESNARVTVTAMSNRKSDYPDKVVASGLASYNHVDFNHWSFATNRKPQVARLKLKVKKVSFYQLIFESRSASSTATILSTDIAVRYTGNVK